LGIVVNRVQRSLSSDIFYDALGAAHARASAQARIVSLVPSITELLFDLGLGAQVVGRSGFCIHPKDLVRSVPKLGGTKTVDVDQLRALAPSHVIVNVDENTRDLYDSIVKFVPHVVVTHPLGPEDNLSLYRLLGGIFDREHEAEVLSQALTVSLRDARESTRALARERVLYLIWRDPWMTISDDTYIARTLAAVGWDAWTPPPSDRYPKVVLSEALGATVDRVLLSSEPYRFRHPHLAEVRAALRLSDPSSVMLIDGEMCSWYGSRAVPAMKYLSDLRLKLK
jgi:ABC-type Fe3+-hydroxamate transport system substrate-binding protein